MTATSITNAKPQRRQLSDQLDRLDGILDALSEGLNGAVADAAREGTRLAVKDAIVEIMTDPNLRAKLHHATGPEPDAEAAPPEKKLGFWARLKARAGQAGAAIGRAAGNLVEGVVQGVRTITDTAAEAVRSVNSLGSVRKLAAVALVTGVAVGITSFFAPHAVAAAVSGVVGAVAAAAVQVGVWMRRAFRALVLA